MKYYRFRDSRLFRVGFLLFLLVAQLLSRSSMIPYSFLTFSTAQFLVMGMVAAAGVVFLVCNRKRLGQIVTDRRMLAVLFFVLLILGNMAIKQDWQLLYFSILFYILVPVFLSYFLTMEELARYYVAIMTFLSAYALVGLFVLKPLYHMGLFSGVEFVSPGGWYMLNFGLTFTVDRSNLNLDSMRLFGFFREPGLYPVFLMTALHLNNDIIRWKRSRNMWLVNAVLFAAMAATFATAGMMGLVIYALFLYFDKKLYKSRWINLALVAVVAAGVAAFLMGLQRNSTWAEELLWMVQKLFVKTESYVDRMESIVVNTQTFLRHPLVGDKIADVLHSVFNNTATTLIIFASFGIVGGLVHIASWAALVWKKERHPVLNLLLMLGLFLPFNAQNVVHDMFFWLFPVMALVERGLPMLDQIKLQKKVR